MFLFYPFHSFSRFLPIQRGRFGPKKVVLFSICFARQVAVVARARKRWSWSCQRIRSRESSAFHSFSAFFLAGQEYPELEFSLDHWPPFFVRVLIADTVRRTMIARSRLPDKLLTDNAHADSFAMSEDWTICASWKAAVSSATRASEGWTAVRDMFTYCDMIIHQVLATLVDHRILLKHTVSASILLDGSTITRKTKQYLTCPLFFDFCLHCTKPCMRKTFLLVLQETGLMTSLGTCLSQVGRDLDILSSTSFRFGGCL